MFAVPGSPEEQLLHTTEYAQPALFALEVALHHLLTHHTITPDYLIGHSLGEITAAHLAGILTLPDAAHLITTRGHLMQTMRTDGAMTAINATETEILPTLTNTASIAALNSPTNTVITGDHTTITTLTTHWKNQGRHTTPLHVSHAFHSHHTDPILHQLHTTTSTITHHPPTTPLISNLTGTLATPHQHTPEYWTHHARNPVRFHDGIHHLHTLGVTEYLE
ncbi:acyltransferase domain-containing protein, partial [Frankia sp. AiPa1]|uniref:acyltransferase domain-containing protein n=1 Tax=Frankia sp. AiPa1 TaxID=573492 RepID=UPI00202AE7E8